MAYVQVPADGVGKRIDTVTLTDALAEVHRQKMVITGASGTAEVVAIVNAAPAAGDFGLVVRQAGTVDAVVSGTVNVNGGVAISGTATVAGVVGLTAGTANIGSINHISRTVQVAVGTPFILQGISTTVQVAVGTPFTINNISATAIVAGTVALGAGAANIGTVNNISATVNVAGTVNVNGGVAVSGTATIAGSVVVSGSAVVAVRSMYVNTAVNSASRGPRCVIASTSSNATLVAAPGAGMAIFVTAIYVSNASGSNTRARIGTSASIGTIQMMMAASGGGFVTQFTPPWELSANEALLGSVKPNVSEGIFNIHYFVASADAL